MDKFDTLYSVFKELEQILLTLEGKEEKRQVNNALCNIMDALQSIDERQYANVFFGVGYDEPLE